MAKVAIYTLRSTMGQEKNAAGLISQRAGARNLDVRSVLVTDQLRGYLFIEAHPTTIESAIEGIPHVRSKIVGKVPIESLQDLLIPKPMVEGVSVGDIVEITDGPFKGSRARITSITTTREEVTVELLDSLVTIPVVIHADFVRVLQSAASLEEEDELQEEEEGDEGLYQQSSEDIRD